MINSYCTKYEQNYQKVYKTEDGYNKSRYIFSSLVLTC